MSRNFGIVDEATVAASIPRVVPQPPGNSASPPIDQTAAEGEVAKLAHRLFLSASAEQQPRIVAFFAVDRRAGCSWVCAKAAELLATHTQNRVCVVDANFIDPFLHKYFHTEAAPGLTDALRQAEPIQRFVVRTGTNRVWIMAAGSRQVSAAGIMNPSRMRTRMAELREEFDFVLIDVPAMSVSSDAVLLGRMSEGAVMVIASNCTRRDAARAAKKVLEDAEVPILGAVLNKRTYPIPAAVYRRL